MVPMVIEKFVFQERKSLKSNCSFCSLHNLFGFTVRNHFLDWKLLFVSAVYEMFEKVLKIIEMHWSEELWCLTNSVAS